MALLLKEALVTAPIFFTFLQIKKITFVDYEWLLMVIHYIIN